MRKTKDSITFPYLESKQVLQNTVM